MDLNKFKKLDIKEITYNGETLHIRKMRASLLGKLKQLSEDQLAIMVASFKDCVCDADGKRIYETVADSEFADVDVDWLKHVMEEINEHSNLTPKAKNSEGGNF